ncbi:MAG: RHS repeat-associated core domain-containing protein [Clostridia bacterium]|nr:RHS repeat-associated core domain-containing protein [Clostridia bacterium]
MWIWSLRYTYDDFDQLASATKNGVTTAYTYNGDGTRNTKTVDNTTTQYYYVNGRLQALTKDIYTAFFLYDDTGRPYAIRVTILPEGHTYPMYVMAYYKYNLQGDVVGLYNTSGQEFVTYTYDPWGKPLTTTGISPLLIANPFRYRGYVYDDETGLYYCNSRYYDPETGRWINADGLVSTGQGVLGYNTYAYCGNNPINLVDINGNRHCAATTISNEKWYERSLSCHWQNQVVLEKYNPEPIGKTEQGNVYLVKDISEMKASFPGDVIVLDNRGPNEKDNIVIPYSYQIRDKQLQHSILTILTEYESANPTGWDRSVDSMMLEWEVHNCGVVLGNLLPILGALYDKSIHTCFENKSEGWTKWDHIQDAIKKIIG